MPNSLSVYTKNNNKNKNMNINKKKFKFKIKNKNQEKEKEKEKEKEIEKEIEIEIETGKIQPVEQAYESNCLFCFEPAQETNKLFRMKDVLIINPSCQCNGNLHMICLTDWISVSKTCPICRGALTINLDIIRQIDTFRSSALTVKLKLFIRKAVKIFYAFVMMMSKYIAFLFLLNALFRVARDIYSSFDK
jgi:hypothetical protein